MEKVSVAKPADIDTYHDFERLESISTQARVVAWIFLVVGVLILLTDVYLAVSQSAQAGITQTIVSLLNTLVIPLVCVFFYVLLRAVSEGIYVFLDIEENTR